MKISYLYDQGTAKHREDGMFVTEPFVGAVDGVSAAHSRKNPAKIFRGGMTGGQKAARIVECKANFASVYQPKMPLDVFINSINWEVGYFQTDEGVEMLAGDLAGLSFAIAKIDEDELHFAQGGDTILLWQYQDGSFQITQNQVRGHDTKMNDAITAFMREIAKERGIVLEEAQESVVDEIRVEMWDRFYPVNKATRNANINNPSSADRFCLMNGQESFMDEGLLWQMTVPRKDVARALFITDGATPWATAANMTDDQIGRYLLGAYHEATGPDAGLSNIRARAREIEAKTANTSYMRKSEITLMVVEF